MRSSLIVLANVSARLTVVLAVTMAACSPPTYYLTAALPSPASYGVDDALRDLGYRLESDMFSQSPTSSWIVERAGRADLLMVRRTTRTAYLPFTAERNRVQQVVGYGISVRARSYLTDPSGRRRATRPSAAVMADADTLLARLSNAAVARSRLPRP